MWGENITEINITDIDASNRIRNKIQQTWLVNNDKFSQHFYKLCGVAEININWLGSMGEVSFNIVKLHTKLVAREPLLLRWWRLRPPTCSLATVGTPSTRWSAGRNTPPRSSWSYNIRLSLNSTTMAAFSILTRDISPQLGSIWIDRGNYFSILTQTIPIT